MAKGSSGFKSELIAIERKVSTPDGAGGGSGTSWVEIGQMRAAVAWKGSGEKRDRGAVRAVEKYSFVVWRNEVAAIGVTVKDRIVWNGDVFNIRDLNGKGGGDADAEIFAESGVGQ